MKPWLHCFRSTNNYILGTKIGQLEHDIKQLGNEL